MNLSGEQEKNRDFHPKRRDISMKPNILGDFAQAKYATKREGNPAARFM